jgi:hypothetical protein
VIMTRTSLGDEGMEAKTGLQLLHAFPKIDPVQNRKDLTPGPSREKSDHAQGKFAISKYKYFFFVIILLNANLEIYLKDFSGKRSAVGQKYKTEISLIFFIMWILAKNMIS